MIIKKTDLSSSNEKQFKTIYKMNVNQNKNNSLKMSYYISDKDSSLQSVSDKINIINSINKPKNNDANNFTKLKRSQSI
ncbi:hypothetical protein AshY1_05210 [Candidatus Phytoplasma fraxini]|uniref:Uncharacterized protein n=1 Tax=Ash yellows phytoplasma TaxID=35780 RepID=A0ABZ2U9C0_ASHYP